MNAIGPSGHLPANGYLPFASNNDLAGVTASQWEEGDVQAIRQFSSRCVITICFSSATSPSGIVTA